MILQFFPGNSKLQLNWLRSVAEMRIQQAQQDPSPTKIEPLVALLDKLGQHALSRLHIAVFSELIFVQDLLGRALYQEIMPWLGDITF